jgi:putative transcriptional regulator
MTKRTGRHRPGRAAGVAETFGSKIIGALADFTDALERGDVTGRLTCRQVKLNLHPEPYSAELVKTTRRVLGVSQTLFAKFLGVSPKTVRSWEQGINTPSKMACRFMDEIRRSPQHWADLLRASMVRCDGAAGAAAR